MHTNFQEFMMQQKLPITPPIRYTFWRNTASITKKRCYDRVVVTVVQSVSLYEYFNTFFFVFQN